MRVLLATLSIGAVGAGAVLISTASPTGAVIGGGAATSILGICLVLAGVFGLADVQHGEPQPYRGWLNQRQPTGEDAIANYHTLAAEAAQRHRHPTETSDIGNLARTYLKERRLPKQREELIRVAQASGYETWDGAHKGTQVLRYDGTVLATIPKNEKVDKGVARDILTKLADGHTTEAKSVKQSF